MESAVADKNALGTPLLKAVTAVMIVGLGVLAAALACLGRQAVIFFLPVVGAAFFCAVIIRPKLGIYAFLTMTFLVFDTIPGYRVFNDLILADFVFFLAVFALIVNKVKIHDTRKIPWLLATLVMAFVGWQMVGNLASSSQFGPSMSTVLIPLRSVYFFYITVLFCQISDDMNFIRKALGAITVAVIVITCLEVIMAIRSGYLRLGIFPFVGDKLINSNSLGRFLVYVFPILIFFLLDARRLLFKFFFLGLALFVVVCSLFTFSKGSWLGLVVVLVFSVIQLKELRTYKTVISAAVLVAAILIIFPSLFGFIQLGSTIVNDELNTQGTIRVRSGYIHYGVDIIKDHPITGVGLKNLNTASYGYGSNRGVGHDTHFTWTYLGAGMGVPGIFILISIFTYIFVKLWELKGLARGDPSLSRLAATFITIFMAEVAMTLPTAGPINQRAFWIFIGLLLALVSIAKKRAIEAGGQKAG